MGMGELMTPLMREEIEQGEIDQNGGVMGLVQAKQRQAFFEKREKFFRVKLQRDIKKRNKNRVRNKNARRARRQQR